MFHSKNFLKVLYKRLNKYYNKTCKKHKTLEGELIMLNATAEKPMRYTKKFKWENEKRQCIREMLAMMENEKVEEEINYDKIQMSRHALQRVREHTGISDEKKARRFVIDILKKSTRIGVQVSKEGRINVLYAYEQHAVYLSPNLENVVTFHKLKAMTFKPMLSLYEQLQEEYQGAELQQKLIEAHKDKLARLEEVEQRQFEKVSKRNKELTRLEILRETQKTRSNKTNRRIESYVKKQVVSERRKLIKDGERLFNIKSDKRKLLKSLCALLTTNTKINIGQDKVLVISE